MPHEAQSFEHDTAEIVAAYLSRHQLPPDQIGSLIRNVLAAFRNFGKPADEPVALTPAVPIRRSVRRDYVVCLECGWRGKVLRRHLGNAHDLSRAEYRQKWGLSSQHPLTAPAYAEARSAVAKQRGLGRHRQSEAAGGSLGPDAEAELKKPARRRGRGGRRPAASAA